MKIKRPNAFLYFITYILIYPLMKLMFRLKTNRRDYIPPDGAFVVIANHLSFMDFLIVMLSFYPRRLNAVAAQKFYLYRPLHKLLPLMGCIPKNLFDPDVRSIIGIKNVLKNNGSILLFPEGRCETDGEYAGIHKSTGKLIKKLGVPVVSGYIDGAYKCMPFWRGGLRCGNIRITLANLFSKSQLESMTVDEINSAIDRRLGGEDHTPPKKPHRTFRAKQLAEGLQNILYLCPACESEFMTETSGNTIRCKSCGIAAVMDRDAVLTPLTPMQDSVIPGSVQEWFRKQIIYESMKLNEDMDPVEEKVTLRLPSDKPGGGMIPSGEGTIRLDPSGWCYTGEISGENKDIMFPIDTVPAIPFDPDDNFQIYAGGIFYMFTPADARKCVKYAVMGECMYWKFASQVQMTPRKDNAFSMENDTDRSEQN